MPIGCLERSHLADGDVDDITDVKEEGVDTLVSGEESVNIETEALGDDEEGVARDDGVGGRAVHNAGGVTLLGQAGCVVGVADICRDLEDLAEGDEVGVGKAVGIGDIADATAELLGDDGQGVVADDGVLDGGARGASRSSGGRGGGSGSRVLLLIGISMLLPRWIVCNSCSEGARLKFMWLLRGRREAE